MEENKTEQVSISISPPNFKTAEFTIIGSAPLVINKFSQKSKEAMKTAQEQGSQGKKGKRRDAKNFKVCYENAKYKSPEGWCGIHAGAFRAAMISASGRLCGFKMTISKLSVFVEADGYDEDGLTPLVKITKGKPIYTEMPVRLASGVMDIRPRPMWKPGWEAVLRIRFDADQFSLTDLSNLIMRVGMQVGICEGRPDSKNSAGQGWGLFSIKKSA